MSVLGDLRIRESNLIEPFCEENLQKSSYDLTLDEYETQYHDNILKPYETALVSTKEKVKLPHNIAGLCKSRSSYARLGLVTGDIGGWIDAGYHGNITLRVVNHGTEDINMDEIDRFAQIVFFDVDGASGGYDGHYQDSEGLTESVL